MTTLISLFAGGWNFVLAGLAVVAAIAASYFGGKKVARTQEKAKADVAEAERVQRQVEEKSNAESQHIQIAKDVQQDNAALSDDAARRRMQESKYNSPN